MGSTSTLCASSFGYDQAAWVVSRPDFGRERKDVSRPGRSTDRAAYLPNFGSETGSGTELDSICRSFADLLGGFDDFHLRDFAVAGSSSAESAKVSAGRHSPII